MTRYRRFDRQGQLEVLIAKARNRAHTRAMDRAKTLDHLPPNKQRELAFVVEVLREEFARRIAGKQAADVRDARVLKIILFGSYSRDDWVEDPIGRYYSDFDVLVVTSTEATADFAEFWADVETRLMEELGDGRHLRTPVSLIVHSMAEVNAHLEKGRYFFVDIVRDGIPLFEAPGHDFVEAKPLAAEAALVEAQLYFSEGAGSAERRLKLANDAIGYGYGKEAAFLLHQTAEAIYQTLMLVMTLHAPKSHNLSRLRQLTEPFDARLRDIWPTETKFQKRSFELLKQGYVNARYSEHYKVTSEELAFMAERIEALGALVVELCQDQLTALAEAAKVVQARDIAKSAD